MATNSISNIVFDYPTAPPSLATHLNAPGHSIRNSSHHFHPVATAKIGKSSCSSSDSSGPIQSSSEPLRVPTRVNPTKNQSSISFIPSKSESSSSSNNKSNKSLNSSTIKVTEVGAVSSVESPNFWARKSRNAGFKKEDNLSDGLATFLSEKKTIEDGRPENISGATLKRSIATPVPNEKPTSKVKTIAPPSNDDPRPNRLAQIPPPVIKEKARGKAKLKETQPTRPTFATHY